MNEKSLTIDNVGEYRKTLIALLRNGSSSVFDLSGIECIDLSGLQVLISFAREAQAKKIDFHFTGRIHESISTSLILSGITDRSCATGDDVERLIKAVI